MERKWPKHLPFSSRGCWCEQLLCSTFTWKHKNPLGWIIFLPLKIRKSFISHPVLEGDCGGLFMRTCVPFAEFWRDNSPSGQYIPYRWSLCMLEAHLPSWRPQQMPSHLDNSGECIMSRNYRAPSHRQHRGVETIPWPGFHLGSAGAPEWKFRPRCASEQHEPCFILDTLGFILPLPGQSLELLCGFQNHRRVCL